jgi:hypothetical protein
MQRPRFVEVTVAHADQLDPLESEARGDAPELGHVLGKTRQILDQDDLECRRRPQRRGKELLVAREVLDPEAGEGRMLERGDDRPALALGIRPAPALLILDPESGGCCPVGTILDTARARPCATPFNVSAN